MIYTRILNWIYWILNIFKLKTINKKLKEFIYKWILSTSLVPERYLHQSKSCIWYFIRTDVICNFINTFLFLFRSSAFPLWAIVFCRSPPKRLISRYIWNPETGIFLRMLSLCICSIILECEEWTSREDFASVL